MSDENPNVWWNYDQVLILGHEYRYQNQYQIFISFEVDEKLFKTKEICIEMERSEAADHEVQKVVAALEKLIELHEVMKG